MDSQKYSELKILVVSDVYMLIACQVPNNDKMIYTDRDMSFIRKSITNSLRKVRYKGQKEQWSNCEECVEKKQRCSWKRKMREDGKG